MFFQFTLAWSKIRPTRLRRRLHASGGSAAAAVRQAREVGGSGQNLAKKGCTCTRKRAGEFRPFRYTSLSVRSAAAWRFDGFFSNGEWRHHRPLGYARPWRQTPFFVSLFRLLLFFAVWPPFLLLPLTCRGFTSSSSTLSCWLKTQWQKKPCVLCLLAYYSVRKIFFCGWLLL